MSQAEYIKPIAAHLLELAQTTVNAYCVAAGLEPFAEFGYWFTGQPGAVPAFYAHPSQSEKNPRAQHTADQVHTFTIQLAIAGSDPESLTIAAMDYVAAVDHALTDSDDSGDWAGVLAHGQVKRVWVQRHNYGPVFALGAQPGKVPVLELLIQVEELL